MGSFDEQGQEGVGQQFLLEWSFCCQIEDVVGVEEVEVVVCMEFVLCIVDCDVVFFDYFEVVVVYDDCGVFVEVDVEQFWFGGDDFQQVELVIVFQQVLVDGDVVKKIEVFFVVVYYGCVCLGVIMCEVRVLDGCVC